MAPGNKGGRLIPRASARPWLHSLIGIPDNMSSPPEWGRAFASACLLTWVLFYDMGLGGDLDWWVYGLAGVECRVERHWRLEDLAFGYWWCEVG